VNTGINLGILGCAKISQVAIIDAAKEVPDVAILAVGSRSQADADAYAQQHGISKAYGSYGHLLADPDIDVVYNPLPNHLHEKWTIAALEAGKHVLVEKPLAANADQALRMVKAANKHSLHLIEAFHYRYHPMSIEMLSQLHVGVIGTIRKVEVTLKVPKTMLEDNDIRLSSDCAGGAAMDLGSYGINLMRAIYNEDPTIDSANPEIVADNIDGAMQASLRFSKGVTGTLVCSIINDSVESLVKVYGGNGTLEAKNPFLPQFGHSLKIISDGKETKFRFPRTTTYVYQLQAVTNCLLKGMPCATPASDGIANMAILDGIYAAAGLKIRGK